LEWSRSPLMPLPQYKILSKYANQFKSCTFSEF
jgi:hypothetical protein